MSEPKAPAGWYDDPKMVNTRRYWDGEKWTEHRQEKTAHQATAQALASAQQPEKRGFFARPMTLGTIVAIAVVAWIVFKVLENVSGTSVDTTDLESTLESGLVDKGYDDPVVTCSPVDGTIEQGDETVCDVTDTGGKQSTVLVTFNSDGSFIYRVQ